jgi:hypothetical protein
MKSLAEIVNSNTRHEAGKSSASFSLGFLFDPEDGSDIYI